MLKRIILLLTALLCLSGLSGCVFGSVDEIYALPESSESYVDLQAKINEVIGSGENIAPLSGKNRQTIQLVDLDGDREQEAVAFFRDPEAEAPLKIVIFKMDREGTYQVHASIEGVGSEIQAIDYLDLCGAGGGKDILVSWQVSAGVRTLVGYALTNGAPVEILRTAYDDYLAADLDGDGQQELALTRKEEEARWLVDYYDGGSGTMELVNAAPLSRGATEISVWSAGKLAGETPGLFVTSYLDKEMLVTDVLCVEADRLENLSLREETHRSDTVFRYYAGVSPVDMNGDGLTDVPVGREIPSYGNSSAETFWWMQWMTYGPDGAREQVLTTYHGGDGWYLEIPEDWTGDFSMCRRESAATGVRSVTFAKGLETEADEETGAPATEARPFLDLSALVGVDRGEQSRQGERFVLRNDGTTIYTGEFLAGWDCGLDQESLAQRYHSS